MIEILWIVIIVILAQAIIGPFTVYWRFAISADPSFETFDPNNPGLRLPKSYFEGIQELNQLGFETRAYLYDPRMHTGSTRTFLTYFANREEATSANVTYIINQVSQVLQYIEFCTDFEDGFEQNTNNSKQPGVFANTPEKRSLRLPHVKEPAELYRIHRAFLAEKGDAKRKLCQAGQEAADLCNSMKRTLARQAELGYFYLDEAARKYRPTIKGAILMTWKLVWPVGTVRKALQRIRGKQLAASLPTERICSECGKLILNEDVIRLSNAQICASCKPIYFQKIKEGSR